MGASITSGGAGSAVRGSPPLHHFDIPTPWKDIDVSSLRGVVMIIGGTDTGKSTFARYVCRRARELGRRVALLDGDPGQSTLGPPTTMTLAFAEEGDTLFPSAGRRWRYFVGSVSPRGHMLNILVGASRLVGAARAAGAQLILYDTTGFIEEEGGGINLKWAKCELLRPSVVFAIQRGDELHSLLSPLRRSGRTEVHTMEPASAVQPRDVTVRRAHRAAQYRAYFAGAAPATLNTHRVATFPRRPLTYNQLIGLEDDAGFALGLGIVRQAFLHSGEIVILTPLTDLSHLSVIRLGRIAVDPSTFEDRHLPA